jgi:hypothetical protein
MKRILVLCILLIAATPAFATVANDEQPPTETTEMISIAVATGFGFANIAMMLSGEPSYWMGGLGIGVGVTALAMTSFKDPAYEMGLWVGGTVAITTGLIALRYRQVLNMREGQTRIEPTWTDGSPGLALVIDF